VGCGSREDDIGVRGGAGVRVIGCLGLVRIGPFEGSVWAQTGSLGPRGRKVAVLVPGFFGDIRDGSLSVSVSVTLCVGLIAAVHVNATITHLTSTSSSAPGSSLYAGNVRTLRPLSVRRIRCR
jgi:hypothetical protein